MNDKKKVDNLLAYMTQWAKKTRKGQKPGAGQVAENARQKTRALRKRRKTTSIPLVPPEFTGRIMFPC
ncbi:MAG: hypothetical protein R2788_12500 [Saprospiraceae bacterium]